MQADRARIEEDLRGIVAGEVLCDDAGRGVYATDGSLFEAWPAAVVRPRSAEDVAATVAWAAERGIPVHARGAGSSICGGPLGTGIVIDCSRFMRRILRTDPDSQTVRVQPGVVAAQLEAHLARFGRMFGPDPSSSAVTTIGGMIGRNASGSAAASRRSRWCSPTAAWWSSCRSNCPPRRRRPPTIRRAAPPPASRRWPRGWPPWSRVPAP
jgi:FAD/FMN-containing dehydrogenase